MKQIVWEVLKVLVLAAAIYLRMADPLDFHREYTNNIANTIINFVILIVGAKLILQLVARYFSRQQTNSTNIRLGLRNIYYIFLGLAVVMVGLSFLGIDYRTLFTSLSIVAAAIAIVSKEFIAEIISGILLSFSKRILIGDYVKIGMMKGKILDMGLHKITFLNEDDDIIFIPNTKVYNSEIINYTQSDQRRITVDFQMKIAHVQNFDTLEEELREACAELMPVIEPESFVLRISNPSSDVVDLKVLFTARSAEPAMIRDLRRKVTRRVLNFVKVNTPPEKTA